MGLDVTTLNIDLSKLNINNNETQQDDANKDPKSTACTLYLTKYAKTKKNRVKYDAGNDEDVLTPVQNNKSVNIVHEVKPDETLFSIGKMYGITADDIKKMNPSLSGDKIKPGDKLNIRYIKVR